MNIDKMHKMMASSVRLNNSIERGDAKPFDRQLAERAWVNLINFEIELNRGTLYPVRR